MFGPAFVNIGSRRNVVLVGVGLCNRSKTLRNNWLNSDGYRVDQVSHKGFQFSKISFIGNVLNQLMVGVNIETSWIKLKT